MMGNIREFYKFLFYRKSSEQANGVDGAWIEGHLLSFILYLVTHSLPHHPPASNIELHYKVFYVTRVFSPRSSSAAAVLLKGELI